MTESKTAVTLPVVRETTIVAEVRRPPMTARDEVKTAMDGISPFILKDNELQEETKQKSTLAKEDY